MLSNKDLWNIGNYYLKSLNRNDIEFVISNFNSINTKDPFKLIRMSKDNWGYYTSLINIKKWEKPLTMKLILQVVNDINTCIDNGLNVLDNM